MKSHGPQPSIVTIAIPFRNAERTLPDAIRSVFAQTLSDWTLLLLDDGSTDDSLKIARQVKDPRVHVVSDGRHLGLAARLNQVTQLAQTPYIARMDADDMMLPLRLERQIDYLELHSDVDLVATGAYSLDLQDDVVGYRHGSSRPFNHEQVARRKQGIIHASVVGRRSWFLRHPYDRRYQRSEDAELWMRASKLGDFSAVTLADGLYLYRESLNLKLTPLMVARWEQFLLLVQYVRGWSLIGESAKLVARTLGTIALAAIGQLDALLSHRNRHLPPTMDKDRVSEAIGLIRSTTVPGMPQPPHETQLSCRNHPSIALTKTDSAWALGASRDMQCHSELHALECQRLQRPMPRQDDVSTLWIGGAMGPYEHLCLTSFVQAGFKVHVYNLDPQLAVPIGTHRETALEVLTPNKSLRMALKAGSYAQIADVFRYELLRRKNTTWIDADVLKGPRDLPSHEYILGDEDGTYVNNAILRAPQDSELLQYLSNVSQRVGADRARGGELGPHLLTEAVQQLGIRNLVLPQQVLYPIPYWEVHKLFDPSWTEWVHEQLSAASTLHLWNEILRSAPRNVKQFRPPDGSFLAEAFQRSGIDLGSRPVLDTQWVREVWAKSQERSRSRSRRDVARIVRFLLRKMPSQSRR